MGEKRNSWNIQIEKSWGGVFLKLSKWEIPEWVRLRETINVKIVFGEFALIQQDKKNILKGGKNRVK